MAFSPDGRLLAAQGAAPEWNLVLWIWEKSKVVTSVKTTNNAGNPVYQVECLSAHALHRSSRQPVSLCCCMLHDLRLLLTLCYNSTCVGANIDTAATIPLFMYAHHHYITDLASQFTAREDVPMKLKAACATVAAFRMEQNNQHKKPAFMQLQGARRPLSEHYALV